MTEPHWLPGGLILVRAPWDEGLQVPVTLTWLGQGRNRVTYDLQPDRVLKLLTRMHFSNTFPRLCAPVIWEGPLTLQWDNARERGTVVMNGLVMKKCHWIKPWLIQRQGTVKAFEFLAYTLVLVRFLFHQNVQLRDIGSANLAVEDISQEYSTISFIDLPNKKTSSGFWELAKQAAPASLALLKCLVSQNSHRGNVEALLQHCFAYHDNLRKHGILDSQSRILM